MRRGAVVLATAVVACSGRALAHGDGGGTHAWLGPVAFLAGVAVASGAVFLDARDAVASGPADVGVFLGVGLAVVGLVGYVVV